MEQAGWNGAFGRCDLVACAVANLLNEWRRVTDGEDAEDVGCFLRCNRGDGSGEDGDGQKLAEHAFSPTTECVRRQTLNCDISVARGGGGLCDDIVTRKPLPFLWRGGFLVARAARRAAKKPNTFTK